MMAMPKRALKIASFDGNGPRSYSQLKIMQTIMHRVQWDEYPDDPSRVALPCEYFDLIGGSDTGGLIAIMFVKLRMSVEEAMDALGTIVKDVYKKGLEPRERTAALKAYMESLLIKRGHSPNLRLEAEKHEECVGFVLATPSANLADNVCLRTYYTRADTPTGITMVDAVLATCASPSGFLPVPVVIGHESHHYVGAAFGASNPIRHVIAEAYSHFGKESSISLLLSVGSGHPGIPSLPIGSICASQHRQMHDMMLNCELEAREIQHQMIGLDTYFRFSVEQGMQQNHIFADNLGWISAQTSVYLSQQDTTTRLDKCIDRMIGKDRRITPKILVIPREIFKSKFQPSEEQTQAINQLTGHMAAGCQLRHYQCILSGVDTHHTRLPNELTNHGNNTVEPLRVKAVPIARRGRKPSHTEGDSCSDEPPNHQSPHTIYTLKRRIGVGIKQAWRASWWSIGLVGTVGLLLLKSHSVCVA